MRNRFLPYSQPAIGEEEVAEVVDCLRSGWITTGPRVQRFEAEFATWSGAERAVALSSCTAALHLALTVLGLGKGSSVISSTFTFCSSIHVIEHVGSHPVLVDVDPLTLNIDPVQVERAAAESNVKAVLPVHLYGHPCDMDALRAVAEQRRLALVEDAAHALGARYRGRLIGGRGWGVGSDANLVAFSFYATKNLTTAEGGMLTGPAELVEAARLWSLHGMSRDAYLRYSAQGEWHYDVVAPGFKYNMTDIQAALGLVQLRRFAAMQERRTTIAQAYTAAFNQFEEITPPPERLEVDHAWHIYSIRLNLDQLRIDRGQFINELKRRNIGTSVHFIPIHLHRYYREKYGLRPEDFPVATREYERIVSLPLHPGLSDGDVQDVIQAVEDVIRFNRR
ncbi:MAG: DegT/DnrJ/EryC1/StrS aminotransferase family protein [Candidatus Dormibacteraeota bacterium]|nr:DegT/DnrJ/EryC1/StrS aminotransferase family protein [Candidatus Dormibacteraeota bacterium]